MRPQLQLHVPDGTSQDMYHIPHCDTVRSTDPCLNVRTLVIAGVSIVDYPPLFFHRQCFEYRYASHHALPGFPSTTWQLRQNVQVIEGRKLKLLVLGAWREGRMYEVAVIKWVLED